MRHVVLALIAATVLAGCSGGDGPTAGPPAPPEPPSPPPPMATSIELGMTTTDGFQSGVDTVVAATCHARLSCDRITYFLIEAKTFDENGVELSGLPVRVSLGADFSDDDRVEVSVSRRDDGNFALEASWRLRVSVRDEVSVPRVLPVIASLDSLSDTVRVVFPVSRYLLSVDGLPQGISLSVGEEVEFDFEPLYPNLTLTSTASADRSVSSDTLIGEVLRVRGLRSGVNEMRLRWENGYEWWDRELRVGVDYCYEPPRRYPRAESEFQVSLRFENVADDSLSWSDCFRELMENAIGHYEAILAENTDVPSFDLVVRYDPITCRPDVAFACGGPRGALVTRADSTRYYSGGQVIYPIPSAYSQPFGRPPLRREYETMLHEVGHAFGVGITWHGNLNPSLASLVNGVSRATGELDTHFPGPQAVAAFNAAGGSGYPHGKVPVMNDPSSPGANAHWRAVVCGEVMSYCLVDDKQHLTAITVGALADLGWKVDLSHAEPYTLPTEADLAASRVTLPEAADDALLPVIKR